MNDERKICTGLYGGKSSFIKGTANIKYTERSVYCDDCDKCGFYAKDLCLRVVRGFESVGCVYGTSKRREGYTARAKKCEEWNNAVKNDPVYDKLHHPRDVYAEQVGEYLYINDGDYLKFKSCDDQSSKIPDFENSVIKVGDSSSFMECRGNKFIRIDEIDLLAQALKKTPTNYFYGTETRYQKEFVPQILTDLARNVPDVYAKLLEKYPEFKEQTPNYVGRTALISTLADGCTVTEKYSGKVYGIYTFDKTDQTLSGVSYKDSHFGVCAAQEVTFRVTEKMTCQIESNEQVCAETRFI